MLSPVPVSNAKQPATSRACRAELRCRAWIESKKRECRTPRVRGSDRCLWHSPALSGLRLAASAKGGAAYRRSVAAVGLLRFKLGTQTEFSRFLRGVLRELLERRLNSSSARFAIEQAQRIHEQAARERERRPGIAARLAELLTADSGVEAERCRVAEGEVASIRGSATPTG